MRKIKCLLAVVTLIYFLSVAAVIIFCCNNSRKINSQYKVDINRIYNKITREYSENGILNLDIKYDTIKEIKWLSTEDSDIDSFYSSVNGYEYEIRPFYYEGSVIGYLKFMYAEVSSYTGIAAAAIIGDTVVFLIAVIVLIYVMKNVMEPFNSLSTLPSELAKGNYSSDIKENRGRYFGRFVWGMGMLKDSLDAHKKQELKLAKDKKMILLSISHDIKTPLNAICLYAGSIEKGMYDTPEQTKEAARHIIDRSKEIDGFVREIIQSSTEEVISISVNPSDIYINSVLDKIRSFYREKMDIRKTHFEVNTLNNYMINCDFDRLYEAIGNLIENAVKYGDGKSITINCTQEEYCVLIAVENTGSIVSDSDMGHLFDSFYRGCNVDGKAGNGLGLYICSEIMHKMQGDIYAQRLENGMRFTLVCKMS